jgi:hypothetical protein
MKPKKAQTKHIKTTTPSTKGIKVLTIAAFLTCESSPHKVSRRSSSSAYVSNVNKRQVKKCKTSSPIKTRPKCHLLWFFHLIAKRIFILIVTCTPQQLAHKECSWCFQNPETETITQLYNVFLCGFLILNLWPFVTFQHQHV